MASACIARALILLLLPLHGNGFIHAFQHAFVTSRPPTTGVKTSHHRRCGHHHRPRPTHAPPNAVSDAASFSDFRNEKVGKSHHFDLEEIDGPFDSIKLRDHWGRSPLLIRNAFSQEGMGKSVPTWSDVVDLVLQTPDEARAEEQEEYIVDGNNDSEYYDEPDDDDDYDDDGGDDDDDYPTSRVIQHVPGTLDTYKTEFGPFPPDADPLSLGSFEDHEDALAKTGSSGNGEAAVVVSTLLVNDVDRYVPSLSDWMDEHFRFLPRWRRDDAQISLARTGGGIGPHVDNYDVFLIQASGSRRWQVGDKISTKEEYDSLVEASQVRVLDLGREVATVDVELNVGDCLYLPPRTLHQGVATSDDCMTLSVGCRSPSASELVSRVAERVTSLASPAAVKFFTDEELVNDFHSKKQQSAGTSTTNDDDDDDDNARNVRSPLDASIKDKMKMLVRNAVEEVLEDDALWDEIVGMVATEPRRPSSSPFPISLDDVDDDWKAELGVWGDPDSTLNAVLQGEGALFRAEGLSCAWSSIGESCENEDSAPTQQQNTQNRIFRLFAKGHHYALEPSPESDSCDIEGLLDQIANGNCIDRASFARLNIVPSGEIAATSLPPNLADFVKQLIFDGILYGESE